MDVALAQYFKELNGDVPDDTELEMKDAWSNLRLLLGEDKVLFAHYPRNEIVNMVKKFQYAGNDITITISAPRILHDSEGIDFFKMMFPKADFTNTKK